MGDMRKCGTCTLCCIVMEVPELDKAAGQDCKNRTDSGCSIYNDRPIPCREFNCLWKFKKIFKDKDCKKRPDNIGVVIIPKESVAGYSPGVQLIAMSVDAFKRGVVKKITNNLSDRGFNVAQTVAGKDTSWLIRAKQ